MVSFKPQVEGIVPVEYRYDFDGDGVVDNVAPADEAIDFTFTGPGTYRTTVTAIDNAEGSFSADRVVVVQDRLVVDDLLSNRWHALSTSLQAQDVSGSLINLLPESRSKYGEVFAVLGPDLPAIFAAVSPPELIAVEGNMAQYRVKRDQLWEGAVRTITYYLWFVKDEDGVWRIHQF